MTDQEPQSIEIITYRGQGDEMREVVEKIEGESARILAIALQALNENRALTRDEHALLKGDATARRAYDILSLDKQAERNG